MQIPFDPNNRNRHEQEDYGEYHCRQPVVPVMLIRLHYPDPAKRCEPMQPRAVVHVGDNPRAKRDEYCQEGSLPGCSHRAKRFPGNDGQQAKEAGEEESGVSGEKACQ